MKHFASVCAEISLDRGMGPGNENLHLPPYPGPLRPTTTPLIIGCMREGIYRIEIDRDQVLSKGVATVSKDAIRGLDQNYFFTGRAVIRYTKRWDIEASRYSRPDPGLVPSLSGTFDIEDAEDAFRLYRESGGYGNTKVSISGTWLDEL